MKNKNKKIKVLVAMSGGVDSSVAAALLVQQGYDVTGAFMVNYEEKNKPESCWMGDYRDALRVAAKLGIKLLRLNFTKEYKKDVLDYMYKEYEAGLTPNPDVLCNKFVKFGSWLKTAKKIGFDYLATGHYARLSREFPIILLEARDKNKDQTYFLHQLTREQLKYVLFPIGEYTKPQVRALAKKFGLPTAKKEESMGICFIGETPMKKFLMKKIKPNPGKIFLSSGEIVGEHDGLAFYTIGQRYGLSSGRKSNSSDSSRPFFVVEKNLKRNELVVGFVDDTLLYKKEIKVKEINWISGSVPKLPIKCLARLRHRQPLQKCNCAFAEKNNLSVKFIIPQRAVTPGQFAVFYKKGECLGGGEIVA